MALTLALMITLGACRSVPPETKVYIPDFSMQKPTRPVLEDVVLVNPVPPELLRNYSAVTGYALGWEDYYFEHEQFIKDQRKIYNE